jgi:arylsulfatase A-like enzyme
LSAGSSAKATTRFTSPIARSVAIRKGSAVKLLLLAGWCGLAGGLLEVLVREVGVAIHPTGRLLMLSRHFVWAGPLSNLSLLLIIGAILALGDRIWPRASGWFGPRLLCALTILPPLMVALPRIYRSAWALFAFGIAVWLVPWLERAMPVVQRWLWRSFPIMLIALAGLAATVFVGDWLKDRYIRNQPVPWEGAPNVLLIVLDTVRADHLSLYGYERRTTPHIDRLAGRGIWFNEVRAAAPWTLASHATMLTGHWPHELGAQWVTPLSAVGPATLAEYLGSHGYRTAGFVANVGYCSYASRLNRGFAYYEDYELPRLSAMRTAGLVESAIRMFVSLTDQIETGPLRAARIAVFRWFHIDQRKHAAAINRSLVDWLDRSSSPARPFFAFLNYMDAHAAYMAPPGAIHRFGSYPLTDEQRWIIYEQWPEMDKMLLRKSLIDLGRDAYDDCLGYIDDQIGWLEAELAQRGELDRTLLIVTSDHGEGFGEHDLFDHGESLYRTEIRVPLVIVPPGGRDHGRIIHQTVSLRDLPATIVDLVGLAQGSPFPGNSLVAIGHDPTESGRTSPSELVFSELPVANPADPNAGRSPAHRGPLISLAEGDFVYIRNESDGEEQLFDIHDDPRELTSRTENEKFRATLGRFRSLYAAYRK